MQKNKLIKEYLGKLAECSEIFYLSLYDEAIRRLRKRDTKPHTVAIWVAKMDRVWSIG